MSEEKSYYQQVSEAAKDIIEELCKSEEMTYEELIEEQEMLYTRVHEDAESECIYTHRCLEIIHQSSNWLAVDEFDDDCGSPGEETFISHLTRAAFHAYKTDLEMAIQNYEPPEGEPESE